MQVPASEPTCSLSPRGEATPHPVYHIYDVARFAVVDNTLVQRGNGIADKRGVES